MRIRLAIPDSIIDVDVLDAALEATTLANMKLIEQGEAPPISDAIQSGLRWQPENFTDGEHFDLAPTAARRGWGDCDDLAPWLAAEMRLRGDHGAKAFARRSGPNKFHAVVRDGAGTVHDPSRWAGMGKQSRQGIMAAVSGPMACVGEGAIALVPHRLGWAARADLPYGAKHFSGLSLSPYPEVAMGHALRGAAAVSEAAGVLGAPQLDSLSYLMHGLCGDASHPVTAQFLAELCDLAEQYCPRVRAPRARESRTQLPAEGSLVSLLGRRGGAQAPPAPPPAPPPNPENDPIDPTGGEDIPPPAVARREAFASVRLPMRLGDGVEDLDSVPLPGGGNLSYLPGGGPIIVRF